MNKTHKKALGFVGLGLVAALTATAAALPSPGAMATSTAAVVDTIQVYVAHPAAEVEVSTESGEKGTDPNYSFTVTYNNVRNLRIVLENRDGGGGLIERKEIVNEDLDWLPDSQSFSLNLNDYGGYGDFTITIYGLGEGEVPVERILTYEYTNVPDEKEPGDDGSADADIDIPDEKVVKTVVEVYDSSGNLVKTIEINDPNSTEILDLGDLPDGQYLLKIIGLDKHDNILTIEYRTIVIDKDGKDSSIDVPIEDQGQEIGKVTVTVTDKDGNIVGYNEVLHPNPGESVHVPLADDLPAGTYTITTDYYNTDGEIFNTVVTTFTKSDDQGKVPADIPNRVDTVTQVEVTIYDENGNVVRIVRGDRATGTVVVYDKNNNPLFEVPNGLTDKNIVIPMDGLDSGEYTGIIIYRNRFGKQVGNSITIKIKYDAGKAIIVPDTGSFFQNLNISREDYLITGLAVFMVIGVVAFGVVIKNRRTNKNRR